MTHLLNIDEAVDRKFLVTKTIKGQAEAGNIIHVMDASGNSDGSVSVSYRVIRNSGKFHDYQDYNAKFDNLAQFCKWAQPDNFIARNYEVLNIKDIQHYIKVKNRTFTTFCLPMIIVAAVIIWVVAMLLIKSVAVGVVVASILTVVALFGITFVFRNQKKKEKVRMYTKISTGWGVVIK